MNKVYVVLRIRHKSYSLGDVSRVFGAAPSSFWESGVPRAQHKNAEVPEDNGYIYNIYHAQVEEPVWQEHASRFLKEHLPTLQAIRKSGGNLELYITVQTGRHYGDIYQYEFLALLAKAGVDLLTEVCLSPGKPVG
jgi:hypothetical protein